MALLKGVGDFFALDIGTSAVRVVQLSRSGNNWSLSHYGYAPLDIKIASANNAESRRKLGEVIMTAFGQSGIRTKDVVIGLDAQKTFTTVIDVPNMSEQELKASMKYQVDQYIPMPMDEAKVDWALLGQSARDPQKLEVLLVSTAKAYAEEQLEFVENLGFNVIAAEPDPIAMVRSLLPANVQDGRLIVDVGEMSTNLAVTYNDVPRLVRTIPLGLSSLVKTTVQNLGVQDDQARQFILKFGLAPDRLEGRVFHAIERTLENFTDELVKSVKFFQTQHPNISVSEILLSGYASSVPKFGEYIAAKTNIKAEIANPWKRVKVSQSDQQQLASVATEFSIAIGLAQRSNL